jgi:Flp pilus assembly protein TadB
MSDEDADDGYVFDTEGDEPNARYDELRQDLDDLRAEIDDRTVHRSDIEDDLRRYVRNRLRSGHAHNWGPYLVLLYGTIMTIGAFYLLSGGWAIAAMIVIWLSTLGLYVFMVITGMLLSVVSFPGRIRDRLLNR